MNRVWICLILLNIMQPLAHAPSAIADVGEAYGFGSRTAAIGGSHVANLHDPFAAYNNPASLPFSNDPGKRLTLTLGMIEMSPSFTPINSIVVENNYTSDKLRSDDLANVDTPYRDTFGQELGATFNLFPEHGNITAGVAVFLPLAALAYMDTGQTFLPEYVLYRARTLRPQFELGVGMQLSSWLHVGAGLHLAYSLTTNANLFLTSNAGRVSSMRFLASLKPKLSPVVGFLLTPAPRPEDLSIGLVVRLPATADNSATFTTTAQVVGALPALNLNFGALSALFYDPLSLELGTSFQHSGGFRFHGELDYQFWAPYAAPAMQLSGCQDASCPTKISPGNNPAYAFRNILVPRVGEELTLGAATYRIGYAFRPSFMAGLPSGAGNYLDPDKHCLDAGVGLRFRSFLGYDLASELDLNFSYQQLASLQVSKDQGDETGAGTGDLKIGAPGYSAGGHVLGGGASLTLLF